MKYLVLLLVLGVAWWVWQARARVPSKRAAPKPQAPTPAAPQAMAECAHCGLHLPSSDALIEGSRTYCSDAHRLRGPKPFDGA